MNDFNRGALQVPCLRLDYGFGEQWASVELGDGTGYVRLSDYEKAKDENAKLRELAATAWWIAENLCQAFDGSCESCPHGGRDNRCVYEKIQRDLLDMGVEVES